MELCPQGDLADYILEASKAFAALDLVLQVLSVRHPITFLLRCFLVQGKNANQEGIVFYAAEVVLILEYLRKEGIVHRWEYYEILLFHPTYIGVALD